jgi:hypothetical protein
MFAYTLVRETDLQRWPIPARSDQAAINLFSEKLGISLFICEGPSSYWLERRRMDAPNKPAEEIIPVSPGEPRAVATISVVETGFTVAIVGRDSNGSEVVLVHEPADTEAAAQTLLEDTMRKHGITPQELKIKRIRYNRRK